MGIAFNACSKFAHKFADIVTSSLVREAFTTLHSFSFRRQPALHSVVLVVVRDDCIT
jgi:hypothetical protein